MFVCHYDYAICPKLEKEIQSWIQDKKMSQVTLQNIDIRNIQKPEDIKKIQFRPRKDEISLWSRSYSCGYWLNGQ